MASDGPARPRRYHPSERALRALQITYELQIVPTRAYDLIFGSKANRSEQLKALVEAGLLGRIMDPIRRPGPPSHYYAVTSEAYRLLRQLPTGQRRPPAINLTSERILAPGTGHLLAAGQFATSCLYGLPADLAPDWHGEPSSRLILAPGSHYRVGGTYIEPDGVLLTQSPTPAVFYECDQGSEHEPKWRAKIDRYARAATQEAHSARYGAAWPPLLVTVRSRESGLEIAGYLAKVSDEYPELRDWAIWLAVYDAVATPERIDEPAWVQVRVGADPTQPFGDELWSLPEILAGQVDLPPRPVAVVPARPAAEPVAPSTARPAPEIDEEAIAAEMIRRMEDAQQRAETLRRAQEEQQRRIAELEPAREQEREREREALRAKRRLEAEAEAAQRREDMWALAGIVVAVLAVAGGLLLAVPAWINYWWQIDPGLPALWADPNGVLVFQLVTTFSHVSALALLAPFVLAASLLLGWLQRKYRGW